MSENMENMEVQQPTEEIVAEPVAAEIVETPKKKANVLGIIGFICGILSMVLCCSAWIQLLFAIAAIVLCAIGMSKGKKNGQSIVLAIIGLVLGILGTVGGAFTLITNLISSALNISGYLLSMLTEIMYELY